MIGSEGERIVVTGKIDEEPVVTGSEGERIVVTGKIGEETVVVTGRRGVIIGERIGRPPMPAIECRNPALLATEEKKL